MMGYHSLAQAIREQRVAPPGRSLMRRGNPNKLYIWETARPGIALRTTPTIIREGHGDGETNQRVGNGSVRIAVEGIQERLLGGSMSPRRLEKRCTLPSMPAH